jgi:predicted enzyme related to lactoylglutathione lyase
MVGEIIHVEFPSGDFARSSEFFQSLFGWRPEGEQAGGHLAVEVPDGAQASLVMSALAYASGPVVFVAVNDVARTLAEVTRLGGRVLVPNLNLMNKGAVALIADPDGNVMGVTSAQGSSESESQTPKAESRPEHVAAPVAVAPGTRSGSSARAARAQPSAKPAPTKVAPAPAAKSSSAAPPRASAKPVAKSKK